MKYVSLNDLSTLIINNIGRIPPDIDLVVGIPRSGLLVANMIALLTNKSLTDVDGLFENRIIASGKTKAGKRIINNIDECKKILVVEDSVATGNSIAACKEKLECLRNRFEFIFLAAYVVPEKKGCVDICLQEMELPRLFEWNMFHHPSIIPKTCFDIDGVLCEDPTAVENDDGIQYKNFLLNAKAKLIPTSRIGYIVTSRLEKYRAETEKWLQDNNVCYDKLIMLNATAEERAAQNMHASFKARIYKELKGSVLFIESEDCQAVEISNLSGKPVYCVKTNHFYDGSKQYNLKNETKSKIKKFLKKSKIVRYLYSSIKKNKSV